MEQKLDFEHRLTAVEERSKSNVHRLDDLERRQDNLETLAGSVAALVEREKHIESDVKEIKAEVKTLAAKPAKKWESLEEKALLTIVAAAIGYILAQIGVA